MKITSGDDEYERFEALIDFLDGYYRKKYAAEIAARPAKPPSGYRADEIELEIMDELMEDARLEPLINRLEGHLKKGGAETFDRARLKTIVTGAVNGYWIDLFVRNAEAEDGPRPALHQIAKPLKRVIDILLYADIGDTLVALGAPPPPDVGPLTVEHLAPAGALRRYEDLLNSLLAINRAQPPPPEKNPPHRPAKTNDLYELVDQLAGYWESATGGRFTPNWLREGGKLQAATHAAAFVYEAVHYVDRDALPSLRKAAEAAVRRLRNPRK